MKMRRMRVIVVIALAAAAAGFVVARTKDEGSGVIRLPLDLPVVGNVDAVRQWRFGRIESIERSPGEDIGIRIRLANQQVVNVVGPRAPLGDLARACGWIRADPHSIAGRAELVERMIAFDADESGRIIAVISMEPMDRSESRLRRALGG